MDIKVLKVTILPGDKPLKATADVMVGTWKIVDWGIIKYGGKSIQVKCPRVVRKDPRTGEISIKMLLDMPYDEFRPISDIILEAYRRELLKFQGNVTADEPETTVTFKKTEGI